MEVLLYSGTLDERYREACGIPGLIVVGAAVDIRLGVDVPFQAFEWRGFLVGHRTPSKAISNFRKLER